MTDVSITASGRIVVLSDTSPFTALYLTPGVTGGVPTDAAITDDNDATYYDIRARGTRYGWWRWSLPPTSFSEITAVTLSGRLRWSTAAVVFGDDPADSVAPSWDTPAMEALCVLSLNDGVPLAIAEYFPNGGFSATLGMADWNAAKDTWQPFSISLLVNTPAKEADLEEWRVALAQGNAEFWTKIGGNALNNEYTRLQVSEQRFTVSGTPSGADQYWVRRADGSWYLIGSGDGATAYLRASDGTWVSDSGTGYEAFVKLLAGQYGDGRAFG